MIPRFLSNLFRTKTEQEKALAEARRKAADAVEVTFQAFQEACDNWRKLGGDSPFIREVYGGYCSTRRMVLRFSRVFTTSAKA